MVMSEYVIIEYLVRYTEKEFKCNCFFGFIIGPIISNIIYLYKYKNRSQTAERLSSMFETAESFIMIYVKYKTH